MAGLVRVGEIKAGDVLDLVASLVKECSELPINWRPESKSGYLTIKDKKDGRLILQAQIGDCPEKKHVKYRTLSLEKADRLLENLESKKHLSSWQSKDESKDKYGGAIATHELILSFSGLPELADEAVVLITALSFGWATEDEATKIAKISKNPFFGGLKTK